MALGPDSRWRGNDEAREMHEDKGGHISTDRLDAGRHAHPAARGILFMLPMAIAVGVVAGCGAWGFRMLIGLVHNALFLGQFVFSYVLDRT
jgi:hypothetical protein